LIKQLDLSCNKIGDEGAIDLSKNTSITQLHLLSNNIGDEGAKALTINTSIRELSLFNNPIEDEGAKAFLKNTSIIKLDLNNTKIGKKSEKALKFREIKIKRKEILNKLIETIKINNKITTVFPFPIVGGHIVIHEMITEYIY